MKIIFSAYRLLLSGISRSVNLRNCIIVSLKWATMLAIMIVPFYALVLRPFFEQKIKEQGWRHIVKWAAMALFDGEILALGQ